MSTRSTRTPKAAKCATARRGKPIALVALSSAAVCLLFLPAILALLGERVNALAPRGFQGPPSERRWHRLARFVLSYPISVTIVAICVMFAAGLPFLRVQLTQADAKILPSSASAHRVKQVVAPPQ